MIAMLDRMSTFRKAKVMPTANASILVAAASASTTRVLEKSIVRLQSAFVTDEDMSRVVSYLKQQCAPQFNPEFLNFETSNEEGGEEGDDSAHRSSGFDDELYPDIKRFVIENHVASTSFLQRKFSIGYSRAASLLDALEEDGVIRTVGANNRKEVVATSDDIDID